MKKILIALVLGLFIVSCDTNTKKNIEKIDMANQLLGKKKYEQALLLYCLQEAEKGNVILEQEDFDAIDDIFAKENLLKMNR